MGKGLERFIIRMVGWPKEIDGPITINEEAYRRLLTFAAAQETGPQTLLPRFEEVAAAVETRTPNLASAIRGEAVFFITDLLIPKTGGKLPSDQAAGTHAKLTEWLGDYPEGRLPGALEARILLGILEKFTKSAP